MSKKHDQTGLKIKASMFRNILKTKSRTRTSHGIVACNSERQLSRNFSKSGLNSYRTESRREHISSCRNILLKEIMMKDQEQEK